MNSTKLQKQEEKILKLQQELKSSKDKIKSLENKLSTSERKRKSLMTNKNSDKKRHAIIPLQPIKRHKFSEFIVSLSVQLYVKSGCGFRGVTNILSVLKELLGWDFVIPCHNSVENWVKKSGLSIYKEPEKSITKKDYAIITDESMMIGSQKMLLTLGVNAKHQCKPLTHNDVEVLGMSVRSSWNSQSVCAELEAVSKHGKKPPQYVISDNAGIMNKGIRNFNSLQIRDISHTLGIFMERVYSKDDEFISYMKELAQVKFKHVMNPVAYLLPPKQRSIARFLNLSQIVEWSDKILKNYNKLTSEEKTVFSFIPHYQSFIDELRSVLFCINSIEYEIKHNGLSLKSVKKCIEFIKQNLCSSNKRVIKISKQIGDYLSDEVRKLPFSKTCWHASSDVIESLFGVYKCRKSPNPLHGITPFVLFLPLHTRIGTKNGVVSFDFKSSLESVFMSDIDDWKNNKLLENQVCKRIKTLKAA
jgi:transposase-like protein